MLISRNVIATPPGCAIKEQLDYRKMTQKEFALQMDMSEKHISKLINGDVHLTPEVASRLEMVLGMSAEFWNNLEAIYQGKLQKAAEENAMDADIALSRKFPYGEMASLGWVEDTKKPADRVRNLRMYFEVAHLGVLERMKMPGLVYRMQTAGKKKDYVLAAWVQKARLMAREMEVSPVNLAELAKIIPEIRSLTVEQSEKFMPELSRMLADCGIALVMLPHLKGSFLYGASFHDGRKIVMALTLRGRDADKFWFSLFHEIGHILRGHISQPFGASDEDEKEADEYARDTLIPPEKYREFTAVKDYSYSSVEDFAAKIGIDAGIVVGRLQRDGEIDFNELNGLKKQCDIQPKHEAPSPDIADEEDEDDKA